MYLIDLMPTGGTYLTYMYLLYKISTLDSIRYLPTYLLKEWTPTTWTHLHISSIP